MKPGIRVMIRRTALGCRLGQPFQNPHSYVCPFNSIELHSVTLGSSFRRGGNGTKSVLHSNPWRCRFCQWRLVSARNCTSLREYRALPFELLADTHSYLVASGVTGVRVQRAHCGEQARQEYL
ncbi:hypothetical protein VUR80DRAFT_5306 [Thermomyces stellatus]